MGGVGLKSTLPFFFYYLVVLYKISKGGGKIENIIKVFLKK